MERKRIVLREERSRRPGRPRSEAAHGAILDAALALVREVGYDAVTMDGIAARAGVGKATVYRRWAIKETVVADAIERILRAVPEPETGSTEGDLQALMDVLEGMYRDAATAELLSGLVAAMVRSARIAHVIRTGFVAAWRDAARRVLVRGVGRGELRADVDVDLALDLLAGPLFYRFLLLGGRVDAALTRGVVQAVLRGLAAG